MPQADGYVAGDRLASKLVTSDPPLPPPLRKGGKCYATLSGRVGGPAVHGQECPCHRQIGLSNGSWAGHSCPAVHGQERPCHRQMACSYVLRDGAARSETLANPPRSGGLVRL